MKYFLLSYLEPDKDVDFLNTTRIDFELIQNMDNPGLFDMTTKARIITKNDQIVFSVDDEQEKSVLFLKFGDRLKEY